MKRPSFFLFCLAAITFQIIFPSFLIAQMSTFGRWFTAEYYGPLGQKTFCALTYSEKNDGSYFRVGFPKDNCNNLTVDIPLQFATPSSTNLTGGPFVAEVRIDSWPVRNMTYLVQFRQGDRFAYGSVQSIESPIDFLREIISGNTLRIRFLTLTANDAYVRFSLSGSHAAVDRAFRACLAESVTSQDDQYFFQPERNPRNSAPQIEPDRQYFRNF